MKTLWNLTLLASLLLCACNNKPEEVPPTIISPPETLANTIAENYWYTSSYLIHIVDGEEVPSSVSLMYLKWDEQGYATPFYSISPFYCSPEGKIDKYSLNDSDGPGRERLEVRRGIFNLYINPDQTAIRFIPNDQRFADKCIYCDVELRLHSLQPDRIEFDMPMNAVVKQDWAKYIGMFPTTGVRVVWTLMTDEQKEEYNNFEPPTETSLDPIL